MIYLELFLGFLKVGCFSFGGAYAAIPLIRDVVLAYGWLEEEMLTYMIAVGESTPGPIMINLATYVGTSQAGFPGAVIATVSVATPAFLLILLVAAVLSKVMKNDGVQAVLRGVKPCMAGIILATGIWILVQNIGGDRIDLRTVMLTLVLGALYFGAEKKKKGGISPIALILTAAVLGAIVYAV